MKKNSTMSYVSGYISDVGTVKKLNQDLTGCYRKDTGCGEMIMAFVCDGKGGVSRGDVAAHTVGREFIRWLEEVPDDIVDYPESIESDWEEIIEELNDRIWGYGQQRQIKLGAALTVILLLPDGSYYAANVGHSRLYLFDQNRLQRLMENSEIDEYGFPVSRIGSRNFVSPCFINGRLQKGEGVLLCTDGFFQRFPEQEMAEELKGQPKTEEEIAGLLSSMVEKIKQCGERDNISAVFVKSN
ncbi:MAG: PP2C family protein-serine/threonine phosphatase [Lachnospiraceae bacterium]